MPRSCRASVVLRGRAPQMRFLESLQTGLANVEVVSQLESEEWRA